MLYDFDNPPDRRNTDSIKWRRYAGRDILPMWVADMDFAAPPAVLNALQERVAHGVFGYAYPWESLINAVIDAIYRDHNWCVQPEWLVWLPGVVSGFNLACQIAGDAGSAVLTLTPVYPPFLTAPTNAGHRILRSDMVLRGVEHKKRWECDWDDLQARVTPDTRLLMLCNPHNPVGRAFSRDELRQFAEFAEQHDLLICSDEIHCDLVLNPQTPHIPIASLAESVARRCVTLMAPSKTYNIPALYSSFAIIPDPSLRKRYQSAMRDIVPNINVLGLVATEAAYRDSLPWRTALLDYLRGNAKRVQEAVSTMPGLSTTPVDATYLTWIDCRALHKENPAAFFEQHGVGLSDGKDFGAPGFVRLNFGCSRKVLDQALERMRVALEKS